MPVYLAQARQQRPHPGPDLVQAVILAGFQVQQDRFAAYIVKENILVDANSGLQGCHYRLISTFAQPLTDLAYSPEVQLG